MSPIPAAETLTRVVDASLAEAGLSVRGSLQRADLCAAFEALSPETRSKYRLEAVRGAFAVALPYGEGLSEPPAWAAEWLAARPGPLAKIGRFARANWYKELVARLKGAAVLARPRLSAAGLGAAGEGWRFLANSGLPEKRLALAAGLGVLGRHGLVMVPGRGSACVLGLLLLPEEVAAPDRGPAGPGGPQLGADCGSCRACVRACPTGALSGAGYERERCLQFWSTRPGPLPPAIEAIWGDRLYGCDACQEACPRFRPDPAASTGIGLLGPGLPASWLVESPEPEIRARLRGSALGLSWMPIDAFRRNAGMALRRLP